MSGTDAKTRAQKATGQSTMVAVAYEAGRMSSSRPLLKAYPSKWPLRLRKAFTAGWHGWTAPASWRSAR